MTFLVNRLSDLLNGIFIFLVLAVIALPPNTKSDMEDNGADITEEVVE